MPDKEKYELFVFEEGGADCLCEKIIDGIPLNPCLPENFYYMPNDERPQTHMVWWCVPYIQTEKNESWPEGVRYDVRMLDGGAWDRPTNHGVYATLDEAVRQALGI